MKRRCPECEVDVEVPDPPEDPELVCHVCNESWTPVFSDPDMGWRVPQGGPAMWAQVKKRYDRDKVHRAFAEFCKRAGALDYAARRYRRVIDQRGPEDAAAARGLARIQTLAFTKLQPRGKGGRLKTLLKWLLAAVLVLGVAWLTAWALHRLGVVG